MKKPLIILTGPTAVGKTKLSIALAQRIGGEIISADSMQVYKYMNIGSAKITKEEMSGITHHLVDVLEPAEAFNVVRFQQMAAAALKSIYARGKIPIVVGGTGFYIQALLRDIDFDEAPDTSKYRQKLEQEALEKGSDYLYEELKKVDPAAALAIHPHNTKRVIRALEFFYQTGRKISVHNQEQRQHESPYNFLYFVLNDRRERLYQRIETRIDQMIADGLLAEVKQLAAMGCTRDMVSMQGLGYKEMLDYLAGNCTWEEAIYTLKRDTRHFAKRQITWFKRESDVIWLQKEEYDYDEARILSRMIELCEERKIYDSNESNV